MHLRWIQVAARCAGLLLCAWRAGCAAQAPARDYSAFGTTDPASIRVLPPINESPAVQASDSVLSHAPYPLLRHAVGATARARRCMAGAEPQRSIPAGGEASPGRLGATCTMRPSGAWWMTQTGSWRRWRRLSGGMP